MAKSVFVCEATDVVSINGPLDSEGFWPCGGFTSILYLVPSAWTDFYPNITINANTHPAVPTSLKGKQLIGPNSPTGDLQYNTSHPCHALFPWFTSHWPAIFPCSRTITYQDQARKRLHIVLAAMITCPLFAWQWMQKNMQIYWESLLENMRYSPLIWLIYSFNV